MSFSRLEFDIGRGALGDDPHPAFKDMVRQVAPYFSI